MSREVMILSWCDGDHEDKVRAEVERVVTLDGKRPRLVDLCRSCDKLFTDVEWLLDRGADAEEVTEPKRRETREHPQRTAKRKPRRPPVGSDRVDCQEPGCIDPRTGEQYVAPTRTALGQHVKSKHDKRLSDYDWSE